tara:strand:+ start:335 stop:571 length:237 start_codon:yes stop_codon:yes gene_type:complete
MKNFTEDVNDIAERVDKWKIEINESKDVVEFISRQNLTYREASVIKLICRHKKHNGVLDILHAKRIIDRIIEGYDKNE